MAYYESSDKRNSHSIRCSYTSNLKIHPNALEKKEVSTAKRSRKQEIIKIRVETNQLETKKTIQRINETKNCFFEKIYSINQPSDKISKRQREYSRKSKSDME